MKILCNESEDIIAAEFIEINRLTDLGEMMAARKRCEKLYELYPFHPRVMHGTGLLQYRTGEQSEGEALIRKAIELKPDYSDAYQNLGRMLYYGQRLDESEEQFYKASELAPDDCKPWASLALIATQKERYRDAMTYCQKAMALNPDYYLIYSTLGAIMMGMGKALEGVSYYRQGLKLKKEHSIHSCLLFAMNLFPHITQPDIYMESARWGKLYTSRFLRAARPHFNVPDMNRKLRIGYVSGDFKTHPVAYHFGPVLAAHNKNEFEIFLYNSYPRYDDVTEQLVEFCDCYRDISRLPDEKADTLIRKDGIDILVDLAGHTAYNRLLLFARRPAPIQVAWIGYFNTTGMQAMDYLISDEITIPRDEDKYFVEKIVRLPGSRFCYQAPVYAPEVGGLPCQGKGYITFGSFNAVHKHTDEVIALWSRVLHAVPGSKMILKSQAFMDEEAKSEYVARFERNGVSRDRLELRLKSPHPKMLAEYGDIDISLDTFPYNGGATTCEALWMGVPVVTLEGATPIGRQTKGFLYAIGYQELIGSSPDEFVAIAVRLAADTERLAEIRSGLRSAMSQSMLCDGRLFADNLEMAFKTMWLTWCNAVISPQELSSVSTRRFSTDELCDIGHVMLKDERPDDAMIFFVKSLRRDPRHIRSINGYGRSQEMSGNHDRARKVYRRALRLDPASFESNFNLGCYYLDRNQLSLSIKYLKKSVEAEPGNFDALLNVGIATRASGRFYEGRMFIQKSLELNPASQVAKRQLALIEASLGDVPNAVFLLKGLIDEGTDDLDTYSSCAALLSYNEQASQQEIFSLSCRLGSILSKTVISTVSYSGLEPEKSCLRVGFVSSDFNNHPVGLLLAAFFREHDRSKLELFCYYNGSRHDMVTDWYQSAASAWRQIKELSDSDVATMIHNDKIDILIDLAGHTTGHRLPVFQFRPAPIQASWLGYWNTTGLSSIDYIIADSNFIRPQDEDLFREKVVRLPYNRFCFTPPNPSPMIVDQPCVDNGYVTFGSFNVLTKVSDSVIAVWARILQRVPRSRLIIQCKAFADAPVRRYVVDKFVSHGIARNRIELRKNTSMYLMMASLSEVDICLDPFPFTGGMTSLLSLWMGVPVVTQCGEIPVSRQTASFLQLIGLDDMITFDNEAYIERVVQLAGDQSRLHALRAGIRDVMLASPLCDAVGHAGQLQELLFKMWHERVITSRHQKGLGHDAELQ